MELAQSTEITILDQVPAAPALTIGVSAAVATDVAFTDAIRQAVGPVRAGFDPSCDITMVDVAEVTQRRTGGVVVAVAAHPTAAQARRALTLGAAGVLDRRGDPHAIRPALEAVMAGVTVLPPGLTPALCSRLDEMPPTIDLRPRDLQLLRDLASGLTLDDVARVRERSTRTIRRDLRDLWQRMGVGGRAQGLVLAARWGVVH